MEVFSIFATLSLKDLLSGPLARIRQGMGDLEGGVASLGQRMGNLALAMAPLAVGAGAVLGAFGKCVATAAGFEDQMAKVGAVSRASASELQALEDKARELGATTQFTASEVAQAEQYLAMAGFNARQNIAALPGVLNLAAATATDLGRAADISSDILGAFGMKAEEMGRVADVLAMTCATANTNMELLGDTMKYVAPVARTAGLSIEETAAMAGLLGNVGIKGSQAGTTLKAMLNKLAAPASEGAKALAKLGIATKDAAGNLRSPIQVLGELSGKLKEMGTAEQMAAMKAIVGEEAVAGFAELIKQGGIGEIEKYVNKLGDASGACDKMAKTMNDTLAGDLRGLGSAFESVQITIGKLFIPVLRKVVSGVTGVIRAIDKFAQNPAGAIILKIVAAISTAIIAVTAFSGGIWALGKVLPWITSSFGALKASLLGLGAPIWALIGVATLLYVAWKNNFGGIATVIQRWGRNIRLVFEGVSAVFNTLKGTTGEIRGELAKEIKAAGLVNLVTNVGKIVYRIREFFSGIWDGLNFDAVTTAFAPAILKIRGLLDTVGDAFTKIFGGKVKSAASDARSFGEIIGRALTKSLEALGAIIGSVVNAIDILISTVRMICAVFTGDWNQAVEMAKNIWKTFIDNLLAFADLFGIGDWIREAWDLACQWLSAIVNDTVQFGVDLLAAITDAWNAVTGACESVWTSICAGVTGLWDSIVASIADFGARLLSGITEAWDAVLGFFDGLNLFESGAKLLGTFIDGIKSMAGSVVDSVSGVFSKVREFLPFSDAHEGPLSTLTLSGSRMMTTLAEGVAKGSDALKESVGAALADVNGEMTGSALPEPRAGEIPDFARPLQPDLPGLALPDVPALSLAQPNLPGLALPDVPPLSLAQPELPELPDLALPDVPPLSLAQPELPAFSIPEAPAVAPEEMTPGRDHAEGEAKSANQTVTIHIGTINMPDVTDAQGFLKNLQGAFQSEISALAGA